MNRSNEERKSKTTINLNTLIAGVCGGVASTALFHPLELIKVRWQVYEAARMLKRPSSVDHSPSYRPKYRNLFDTVASVYKSENGLRGLYRGIGINTVASGSAWGIYFLIYNSLKSRHRVLSNDHLTVTNYTVDATVAGVLTICITNPLFLIKTRMCLQYKEVDPSRAVNFRNSWHAFVMLLKSDGILGLYKGLVPGLFGTLNGTIQMVTYDLMKDKWLEYQKKKTKNQDFSLNTAHFSIFSSLSKILATTSTYPFQLVRARIQDHHQTYKNLNEVILKTFQYEGLYGFYKGLFPCLIRVTPAASLTFIVYENLLVFLNRVNKNV